MNVSLEQTSKGFWEKNKKSSCTVSCSVFVHVASEEAVNVLDMVVNSTASRTTEGVCLRLQLSAICEQQVGEDKPVWTLSMRTSCKGNGCSC